MLLKVEAYHIKGRILFQFRMNTLKYQILRMIMVNLPQKILPGGLCPPRNADRQIQPPFFFPKALEKTYGLI